MGRVTRTCTDRANSHRDSLASATTHDRVHLHAQAELKYTGCCACTNTDAHIWLRRATRTTHTKCSLNPSPSLPPSLPPPPSLLASLPLSASASLSPSLSTLLHLGQQIRAKNQATIHLYDSFMCNVIHSARTLAVTSVVSTVGPENPPLLFCGLTASSRGTRRAEANRAAEKGGSTAGKPHLWRQQSGSEKFPHRRRSHFHGTLPVCCLEKMKGWRGGRRDPPGPWLLIRA